MVDADGDGLSFGVDKAMQLRGRTLIAAVTVSVLLFTSYCQLSDFDRRTPLAISLQWALINTLSLSAVAAVLWRLRQRLLNWIEDRSLASLTAAVGVVFIALMLGALLSVTAFGTSWSHPPGVERAYQWFVLLLPLTSVAAIAVTFALAAVRWRIAARTATPRRPTEQDWLVLPEAPRLHLRHSDVPIIRAAGNYCELDVAGQGILVRVTATQLEERLKPHGFVRVSRGAIVNLARVRRVRPAAYRRLTLLLDNGSEIAVSRSHRTPFERHLKIWTSGR